MIRLTTVLAALVAGSALVPASAQDVLPVTSVKYAGRYDLATNTFYPSDVDPDVLPGDSNPSVLYDNTATNGSFTTGTGAIKTHHYMDWGTPSFGGSGAIIDEIRIAYATTVVAPGLVSLRIRLYDGATGFGVKGTVIADYSIPGLPNSVSGGAEGFLVDVTLPAPLAVNDGAFGWSYNSDSAGAVTSTGPLLVGPPNAAGVIDAYDRYLETTDAYIGTFNFGGAVMASFAMRLKGRAINPPPTAWANYGVANGIVLEGTGDATPGSTNNNIHISASPSGKNVIVVAGITQSDFFQTNLGLHFYAFPWLMELAPMQTPLLTGDIDLPFTMPNSVVAGNEIFIQVLGQNLSGAYKRWSEGLKLTIQ